MSGAFPKSGNKMQASYSELSETPGVKPRIKFTQMNEFNSEFKCDILYLLWKLKF